MTDIKSIALYILRKRKKEITIDSIDEMMIELGKCQKGRKVQVLFFLKGETRMTSAELADAMKIDKNNLSDHTNRLVKNLLIERYNQTRFKSQNEKVDMRPVYHSITDSGLELIYDLGK